MANSEMFGDYCKEVAKLRFIRPEEYEEDKRKAFFINIYNSLTIHAMVYQASAGNLPDSPMKVKINRIFHILHITLCLMVMVFTWH